MSLSDDWKSEVEEEFRRDFKAPNGIIPEEFGAHVINTYEEAIGRLESRVESLERTIALILRGIEGGK